MMQFYKFCYSKVLTEFLYSFRQPCPTSSHLDHGHAPSMSLPCLQVPDLPKEARVSCAQDEIYNKLENDKLRYSNSHKRFLFVAHSESFYSLRCDHLIARNEFLRQQLEESHRTNQSLTNDLHKLTIDWEHLRDDIAHKEDEWKEEEQVSSFHTLV